MDLFCRDLNGKYVIVEIKIDPDYTAVAQLAKYKVSLEKEGIPKEKGKRYYFEGDIAISKIRDQYINKSVSKFWKRGSQNPIKYINV